jgi:hypothetical protein
MNHPFATFIPRYMLQGGKPTPGSLEHMSSVEQSDSYLQVYDEIHTSQNLATDPIQPVRAARPPVGDLPLRFMIDLSLLTMRNFMKTSSKLGKKTEGRALN